VGHAVIPADIAEAARGLLGHVDDLSAMAAEETRSSEINYRELVEPADLRRSCRDSMAALLTRLAGIPDPDLGRALNEIGRRRARQGVGLEAVLRSFRIDFRIVWENLTTWRDAQPVDAWQHWQEFVLPLWQVIDEISVQVSSAYREAENEIAGERERDLQALFDELLHGVGPLSAVVHRIASRFGLAEHGHYVVIRADGPADDLPEQPLRRAGVRSVWQVTQDVITGVADLREAGEAALEPVLGRVFRGRVGVSPPYAELLQTRRHVWLADAARDSVPPGSAALVLLSADPLPAFIGGAREISDYLAATVLAALHSAQPSERARLSETVRAYLEGDGSVGGTAQRLYRHRNTVLNHVHRFEEMTGLDLARPRDSAIALLALRGARRLGME
jgi:hypothetical protein